MLRGHIKQGVAIALYQKTGAIGKHNDGIILEYQLSSDSSQ